MADRKASIGGRDPDEESSDLDRDEVDGSAIGLGGEFCVVTASHSAARAEVAMPGTASIPRLLTLVPPPIDEELRYVEDDGQRDYGPDPIAEYALAIPARAVFPIAPLSSAITSELLRYFARPTLYVRTPAGRVTYMAASDGPEQATEIIAGWRLHNDSEDNKDLVTNIALGAEGLARWLAARPEGFAAAAPDTDAINAQSQVVRRIIEIEPDYVAIAALPKQTGHKFDGQMVWRTLHALGLRWGDLDQFQWRDPTDQTDYLFEAEVDDGELGYALPEEIAAGRQHFEKVTFYFNVARTPHPAHILQEMARAADTFAQQLDCWLVPMIDRSPAGGMPDLEAAVREVTEKLQACGVKPGSSPVCRLR
jgi:hypothetical protein